MFPSGESMSGTGVLRELFDTIFFFSTILLIPFVAFVLLFQVACVIWSPFAGLMCAIIARRLGLSVWRHALAGAICSVLLLGPWIFLIQRMRNRRVSYDHFVNPIYFALYTTWITVICGNIVINMTLMGMAKLLPTWLGGGASYESEDILAFWRLLDIMIIPTVIGMPILIPCLVDFIRRFRAVGKGITNTPAGTLLQPSYLVPFAGTCATISSIPFVLFVL